MGSVRKLWIGWLVDGYIWCPTAKIKDRVIRQRWPTEPPPPKGGSYGVAQIHPGRSDESRTHGRKDDRP
jgi:hypothetical protein